MVGFAGEGGYQGLPERVAATGDERNRGKIFSPKICILANAVYFYTCTPFPGCAHVPWPVFLPRNIWLLARTTVSVCGLFYTPNIPI